MFWKKYLFNNKELPVMADAVRVLALDMIQNANSGHPGVALGFADVITTLYANHLKFNPVVPDWDARDKVILSKGHASAMLYATLHLAGYPITRERLNSFRKIGGLPGHPERDLKLGVEMTTGPLGQGLASAVGLAMSHKISGSKAKVFVLAGDGDLMEGVALEAAEFAGTQKLRNLIVLWDNNDTTIDGKPVAPKNIPAKFRDIGWNTIELNGNKPRQINRALGVARRMRGPVLLACKTVIGLGSELAGTPAVHGSPLKYDDAMRLISKLSETFDDAAMLWKKLVAVKTAPNISYAPETVSRVKAFKMPSLSAQKNYSTREMFRAIIEEIVSKNPSLIIGGSADLAASTGVFPEAPLYVHYGIREHAMGAIMNGLAMGGLQPYGSTFLVFSDYMRGAMRMSAMMNLPVLYVFSHDSIALGEDGSTHQPVEQLPGLRLVPNLRVYRPSNMQELHLCLKQHYEAGGPSVLILTRQGFSRVPDSSAADAAPYLLSGAASAKLRLVASGSEVQLALSVQERLAAAGLKVAVWSMPVMGKMDDKATNVFIEASAEHPCWADKVFNVTHYGESGPGADVYKHYGFDAAHIAAEILKKL